MHEADHIACEQVTSCHIIKHRDTQKPRGCFVEFETREDLEKALLKDGTVRSADSQELFPCHSSWKASAMQGGTWPNNAMEVQATCLHPL